jgi:hypothetical protein
MKFPQLLTEKALENILEAPWREMEKQIEMPHKSVFDQPAPKSEISHCGKECGVPQVPFIWSHLKIKLLCGLSKW